ncbi:MAG: sulfatase-like hydrolase/transferase [Phycisphaerae bacterium]|nr:sulfatase-like hydrolase/transferase [Phycisphaerae bacterium]
MNGTKRKCSRREMLHLAAGASAAALLGGRTARAAEATPPPNILWITVEDMSCNLGCYGDEYATTPNIDRLAGQSVRYTNVFATAPVCSPVRSCLITGVCAGSLGTGNLRSQFPIPSRMKGFPSYLRAAGYYCTNNVKTDYNTSNAGAIIKASWDECSNKAHWRGRRKGQPFFAIFNDITTHQSRSMVWPYAEFRKKVQAKLAAAGRHDPDKAPLPPYYPDTPVTRRTVARYYDCISVMDANTGRILKQLEEDGLADDTIVFFYSDHGAGLPRHKRLILDSGLHVPLLVRFPAKYRHLAPARAGKTLDRLVSFVDFSPTVLALAGLQVPKYMQGRPFLTAAAGKERTHIYAARDRVDEAYDLARCVRDKNWLYVRNYMPHVSYNQASFYSDMGEIRNEITKLAKEGKLTSAAQKHYAGPARPLEELYDTANDPHQVSNLAGSPQQKQRLEKMRKLLRAWILATKDLGFLPECDLAARSAASTAYEMARGGSAPPLERIIAAAELVGAGPAAMDDQRKLLKDADSAVRYWAAVGLHALGKKARPAAGALTAALGDSSPPVRVEAAWALVDLAKADKALPLLAKELEGADKRGAVRAARALQMLGEKARPVLPVMQRALKASRGARGDTPMFIRFALTPAVKALAERN